MAVEITICEVPESVRDELIARAALHGKTLETFLRDELARLASQHSAKRGLSRLRERKQASEVNVTVEEILGERDADRK